MRRRNFLSAAMASPVCPHILALPFEGEGHINPLLHLCKRLANLGTRVTFLNSEPKHKDRFISSPIIHPLITFVDISDGFPSPDLAPAQQTQQIQDSIHNMMSSFQNFIQDLIEQGIHISCIISDVFVYWSQDVADKFGIPRVALLTCSATCDLVLYALPRLMEEGYVPVTGPTGEIIKDEIIDFIPGMALKPTDLPVLFFTQSEKLAVINKGYETLSRTKYVLSSTFEELETEKIRAMREILVKSSSYLPVGPLLPSSCLGLEEKEEEFMSISGKRCLEWLDNQKAMSVLYVSFGSAVTLSAKQVEEIWKALETSGQPFLLVMRSGLVDDLAEDEGIYQAFLSSTKNQGFVIDWCPQMKVLQHEAVGGFLSHCGWNSTMESICAGVPMIGWPCIAEQNFNIKCLVEDWGIAISLWKGEKERFVGRAEIEAAIEKLMKGEEGKVLRERAMKLGEAARKSVLEGGCSYANLCHFAEAMCLSYHSI